MSNSPELVLVAGIDGGGKTTLMDGLQRTLGYMVLEPTRSAEAKEFKSQHTGLPLDINFVLQRRELFRRINRSFDQQIAEELQKSSVATSGLRLITDISHAVMGKIVGNEDFSTAKIIEDCKRSSSLMPSTVAFVHAPIDIIRQRILRRQARGVSGEDLTGFNSLFFLGHFQEALQEMSEKLADDCRVVSIDTSIHTQAETLAIFSSANPVLY